MMFVTLHELPIATFIVLGLTFLGLIYIHFRGHKMMLAGMNAREITKKMRISPRKATFNIIEELSLSASLGYIPRLYI